MTGVPAGGVREPCPDCGAPLGGREGCEAVFHELGARAAQDAAFAYRRRTVVDAYCLQHPAYIRSIKSFAAHLCGLCAGIERSSDPRAQRAIWDTLQVPPEAEKPVLPDVPATLTIAGLADAGMAEEFRRAADAWIDDVWKSWGAYHDLARSWLEYSIAHQHHRHY